MPILAIDLGTSNVKAAIVTADGSLLGTASRSIRSEVGEDGRAEQDAEGVWKATMEAARDAAVASGAGGSIRGIACASQYSSIVPVDEDGRPTGPMVLWMDQRGAPARLADLEGGRGMKSNPFQLLRWIQVHAIPPLSSGADSLAHMRWLKLGRPEVYRRTATFLEPMDYLTTRLCGRRVSNRCSSFMMLLTDNRRAASLGYHRGLLRWSQIDEEKLPELVPMDAPLGPVRPDVADALGVSREAVVFPGINDTQAGAIGSLAFQGTHAGISIGTTGVCITHTDFKKTDLLNSMATMPSPIEGKYFVLAEAGVSGKALEHFLGHLVFADDAFGTRQASERYAALETAVRRVEPGSGGLLFLPWLSGSQAPAEDRLVRGGFLNLSLNTTREHMARAVLEGVAFNLRWVLSKVERFSKRDCSHVLFYGGGASSSVWSQILADVLAIPVHQLGSPGFAAARGAALLGFVRLGELDLDGIESRVPVEAVYDPQPAASRVCDALFQQFVRAFKQNRRVFQSLNASN